MFTVAGVAATAGDGLMVRKVTTRTADNYQVPCFNGISGTCNKSTVNFCYALVTYPDAVCSIFPPGVACSFPVEAGTYHAPDAFVTFEADWLAINGGANLSDLNSPLIGDYTSRTEIVSSLGAPNELVLGCIDISFTLVAA
ncbi:hypothetical protein DAPPUDRAFT_256184 [Daphnia pulex]|uniref:Uncharacterized protein n=1 Tax=Daphnia pulex TaxID=6669 RepID=E9HAY7_DAPPU|nr:hypothetical protein DAPPUDRAFT_256184 [Daphnia pulex]|eukprot:EFX71114.1 hypothetical protein DAPPUDRAFT_256184 [Daphnia pulex]